MPTKPTGVPPDRAVTTHERAGRSSPSRAAPVPAPASPAMRVLPHALTFFLSSEQRRGVLRALRRLHARREDALLRALGVKGPPTPPKGG